LFTVVYIHTITAAYRLQSSLWKFPVQSVNQVKTEISQYNCIYTRLMFIRLFSVYFSSIFCFGFRVVD